MRRRGEGEANSVSLLMSRTMAAPLIARNDQRSEAVKPGSPQYKEENDDFAYKRLTKPELCFR